MSNWKKMSMHIDCQRWNLGGVHSNSANYSELNLSYFIEIELSFGTPLRCHRVISDKMNCTFVRWPNFLLLLLKINILANFSACLRVLLDNVWLHEWNAL